MENVIYNGGNPIGIYKRPDGTLYDIRDDVKDIWVFCGNCNSFFKMIDNPEKCPTCGWTIEEILKGYRDVENQ